MLDQLKKDAAERMAKCVQSLKGEFKRMRTGRANTGLLEHIRVEYYGTEMPLAQVANVVVEDARTLAVTPWDKTMVGPIEKAIYKSDLGLTPTTAGTVIRIPVPPLTEERRREIIKVAKHEAENARVAVRNVRHDVMNHLRDLLKDKKVSQDDQRRAQEEVQKLTDKHVAEVDHVLADKEKELLSV
jgi:ribosome recycling factor